MSSYLPALDRIKTLGDDFEARFKVDCAQQGLIANSSTLAAHHERLGPPTLLEGLPLWDKGLYQATFKGIFEPVTLLVPENSSLPDIHRAADAYLWDMGRSDHHLTRAEWDACHQAGKEHAEGFEMEVSRTPDDDLRSFVRDYLAGLIYTDRDVPQSMVGSVFMPLALGALQVSKPDEGEEADPAWVRLQSLPYPDPGKEPDKGPAPTEAKPEVTPLPPAPPNPPEPVKPDPEHLERLERAIQWERTGEDAKAAYLLDLERTNQARQAEFEAGPLAEYEGKMLAYRAECQAVTQRNEARRQQYEEDIQAWKQGQGNLALRQKEWERANEQHQACYAGFNSQRLRDLGMIWERCRNNTTAPRSINGFPMFWSFRIMHRDDVPRVLRAIERERSRQKEMEI